MSKVYVICWASAWLDDDSGNSEANSGVHSVHKDLPKAEEALVACKDEFYNEIVYDEDNELTAEEQQEKIDGTQVYGSVSEHYFEIDYAGCYSNNEIHISLQEIEVTE